MPACWCLPCPPKVMDVCGCGDVCHLGHGERAVRGRPWQEAAELGNLCASVTIRKIGQTGTSRRMRCWTQYRKFCKRRGRMMQTFLCF